MVYKITIGQACVRCPDLKLQVEEEAATASSTNASAAAQTTEATPSSSAQSGTGTNSPRMQLCPPHLAPSSRRCHPLQINSKKKILPVSLPPINAAQCPKITVMASFVADEYLKEEEELNSLRSTSSNALFSNQS